MSLNKVMLIGNLGKKPEIRFTPQGKATTRFPLATSEVWNDQQGERQERTDWHNVVVWGKQAETCAEYLKKGRGALIEGRLTQRSWETPDGQKRSKHEVVGERVQFLGGRREGGGPPEAEAEPVRAPEAAGEDDVPF